MGILKNGLTLKAYKGDYKPINIYKGSAKLAGWHTSTLTGVSVEFNGVYNDTAVTIVTGNTVQISDYYAKDGSYSQSGVPSLVAPLQVVSTVLAGNYKYTSTDGIYEFTLTDDLRGSNGVVDRVTFDRISHIGFLEKRIIPTDNTRWTFSNTFNSVGFRFRYTVAEYGVNIASNIKCTHIPSIANYSYTTPGNFISNDEPNFINIRFDSYPGVASTQGFLDWIAANNFKVYYPLVNPMPTPLTFTKVVSSSRPEFPLTFLTATPSLACPASVVSVEGTNVVSHNLANNKNSSALLPSLKKIGSVLDSYNTSTGEFIKNISDWFILDGSRSWSGWSTSLGTKVFAMPNLPLSSKNYSGTTYKYDSKLLLESTGLTIADRSASYGLQEIISVANTDSGFGDMVNPVVNEIKAYFNGWKMCNADLTVPYIKSEIPYNPTTWYEIWKTAGGVTADSSGVTITSNGSTYFQFAYASRSFKPSTKYGFLYTVVNSTVTANSIYTDSMYAFPWSTYPTTVGNNKSVKTSNATITINQVNFVIPGSEPSGNTVKFKNIRIFELPAGSQIESDFTNLTADQLNAKYTFNGLNVKNWVHVTDGLGLTSTLPTASYTGYVPYKMIYQLLNPIVTNLTPTPLQTFYPYTKIKTDATTCKPSISATVKIID